VKRLFKPNINKFTPLYHNPHPHPISCSSPILICMINPISSFHLHGTKNILVPSSFKKKRNDFKKTKSVAKKKSKLSGYKGKKRCRIELVEKNIKTKAKQNTTSLHSSKEEICKWQSYITVI
jgi:hypothetical protein